MRASILNAKYSHDLSTQLPTLGNDPSKILAHNHMQEHGARFFLFSFRAFVGEYPCFIGGCCFESLFLCRTLETSSFFSSFSGFSAGSSGIPGALGPFIKLIFAWISDCVEKCSENGATRGSGLRWDCVSGCRGRGSSWEEKSVALTKGRSGDDESV